MYYYTMPYSDPAPRYLRSISMDAVTKLNHYSKQGTATSGIEPRMRAYFGVAQTDLDELPCLDLEAFVRGGKPSVDSIIEEDGEEEHLTSLSCARPEAKHSGPCDIHGVVGAVCAHNIPVRGSFVDMWVS